MSNRSVEIGRTVKSHLDFFIVLIVHDVDCLLDIAEHKIAVAVIGLGKGVGQSRW